MLLLLMGSAVVGVDGLLWVGSWSHVQWNLMFMLPPPASSPQACWRWKSPFLPFGCLPLQYWLGNLFQQLTNLLTTSYVPLLWFILFFVLTNCFCIQRPKGNPIIQEYFADRRYFLAWFLDILCLWDIFDRRDKLFWDHELEGHNRFPSCYGCFLGFNFIDLLPFHKLRWSNTSSANTLLGTSVAWHLQLWMLFLCEDYCTVWSDVLFAAFAAQCTCAWVVSYWACSTVLKALPSGYVAVSIPGCCSPSPEILPLRFFTIGRSILLSWFSFHRLLGWDV